MDNTFLTYLDQKSLNALIANGLVGRNDWAEFRREAIAALTSPAVIRSKVPLVNIQNDPIQSEGDVFS